MLANDPRNTCGTCHASPSGRVGKTGLVSGILLAVVPKCPFCFIAFSGTAVLCGEGGITTATHTVSSTPTIILTAVISAIVLGSVLFNYHPHKTPKALLVLLPGILAVILSATWGGGELMYYGGITAMFLGIWMNGSFNYFAARLRKWWRAQSATSAHTS